MNNDRETAIDFVLKMEGDYTFDPNDPGGETKYGISKKAYPAHDIKNLSLDEAKSIYLRDYWHACKCDELAYPFSLLVFDTAVNQGVRQGCRLLQMALGVKEDGIIGDKTIEASHKAGRSSVKKFLAERLVAYARLMASNSNLLVFSFNWFHRVLSLTEIVFDDTEKPVRGANV